MMSSSDSPASTSDQHKRKINLTLVLLVSFAGLFFTIKSVTGYLQFFGGYHDDAIYAVCAKSLAEGQGYRIISLPGSPEQTKYPPMFAQMLSVVFVLNPHFPSNIVLLEAVAASAAIWFIWAAAAFLVMSGRATPWLALCVVSASWLNLEYLSFLPVTMADLSCAAFCVIALWLCENTAAREKEHKDAITAWLPVAAALITATLTHMMGVFAFFACLIYLTAARRFRAGAILITIWLIVFIPASWWASTHAYDSPPAMVYYTNYLKAAGTTSQYGHGPFQFVGQNLQSAFIEVMDIALQFFKWALPASEKWGPGIYLLYAVPWAVMSLGLGQEMLKGRHRRLLALWVVLIGLSHLLWPRGVGLRRLLVALPFVYYYLFRGLRVFGYLIKGLIAKSSSATISGARYRRYRHCCAAASVIFALVLISSNLREDILWAGKYAVRVPPPSRAELEYSETSEFKQAYDWIMSNTKPSDVLVWNNDPAAYLFTGRKAIMSCLAESWGVIIGPGPYITSSSLLESMSFARGNYLVIDPISVGGLSGFNQLGNAVEQLMKDKPGLLKPVFTSRYGLITIFRINQDVLGSVYSSTKSSSSLVNSMEKMSSARGAGEDSAGI